ncbi:hypothetical protein KUTeg_015270 [Tegillarca granosa]|uniref:PiggyBac transposable element-derived protein domain-containing protein n=1 Tax=Tegillarca granosa TaxID=220873 RepID=A0ABQ9ES30_TEGGR|nr:hypothetical protein KUTeg_015270 [Tegillarca granosa]
MESDSSGEEFEGWGPNEAAEAAAFQQLMLERDGIGDISVTESESESESESDNETDRFTNQEKQNHPDRNKMAWSRPTLAEMKAFFGICFLMGIDKKPSVRLYWSTEDFFPLHFSARQ